MNGSQSCPLKKNSCLCADKDVCSTSEISIGLQFLNYRQTPLSPCITTRHGDLNQFKGAWCSLYLPQASASLQLPWFYSICVRLKKEAVRGLLPRSLWSFSHILTSSQQLPPLLYLCIWFSLPKWESLHFSMLQMFLFWTNCPIC